MPLPKRRTSKTKKNSRRSHDFMTAQDLSICPSCKTSKRPHYACPNCGYYKGRQVIRG